MDSTITITARGEQRIQGGHFWIYRSDVASGSASPGEVVRVVGPRGRFLGQAFFSGRSQITLRLLTSRDVQIDRPFWRRRIEDALRFRDRLKIDASAYRLVHGDGDLIPSLIVDRYGDYLVMQTLSQGADRLQAEFAEILVELLQPRGILARNDPRVRLLEGLEQSVDVLHGEIPEKVTVKEGQIEYDVDLRSGQKTGAFLDQRENYAAAAGYAFLWNKYYLDAHLDERSRRRAAEGVDENLAARDQRDSQRAAAPLMIALGARVINNSEMTSEQTSGLIIADVRQRLAAGIVK
jgi:23S rRNA (cytosine1962-C5)-methyltransferase